MNKIRLLQITHDLNIGGLQRVVVNIAKNIDKTRFSVSVCTLRERGPLESELLKHGIKVIKLPLAPNGVDYLSFWKLCRILKDERPHIIHTHNTQPLIDGVTAAIIAGVPMRIHTDHAREFPDKKRYMYAEWLLYHFTNQIIAVSESTKNDLIKYEKVRPSKIAVIHNGIDGKQYQRDFDIERKKKDLGIDNHFHPILGFVGRLSIEKGIKYLIRAVKLLVNDFANTLLLIIGEGELLNDLKLEATQLGIERNVLFLGRRFDVSKILQVIDLFILPSEREGLSLVLLEAAAASLPIIATNVGGNGHLVKDGFNGFIIKPRDAMSIYNKISQLMMDESLRIKYGKNSRRIFENGFTLEKMIRKYENIYTKIFNI